MIRFLEMKRIEAAVADLFREADVNSDGHLDRSEVSLIWISYWIFDLDLDFCLAFLL